MKRFARVLPVLAAIILLQAGIEKKGSFDLELADNHHPAAADAPELQKKGSFDFTVNAGGSKGGEVPVNPG